MHAKRRAALPESIDEPVPAGYTVREILERLESIEEAAEALSLDGSRVRRLVPDRIPAVRIGRYWQIWKPGRVAFSRLKRRPGNPGKDTGE